MTDRWGDEANIKKLKAQEQAVAAVERPTVGELASTLAGCGLSVAGFTAGVALVVGAAVRDPVRLVNRVPRPVTSISEAEHWQAMMLYCLLPTVIALVAARLARRWPVFHFGFGFVVGLMGAAVVVAAAAAI